jgi:RimJ/RimL family protein N-acetyltransferase
MAPAAGMPSRTHPHARPESGSAMSDRQPLPEVRLRPFQPQDYPRLLAAVDSLPALRQWSGPFFRYPLDEDQLEAYRVSALGEKAARRIYTACDADGRPVGHVELNDIDGHSARLCRVLVDQAYRGHGYGRAIVRQALRIGFDELGLQRVDLGVYAFNVVAIRCYELEGFVKEGHLRQARRVGDEVWDLELMAILAPEWRQLERARSRPSGREVP